MAIRRRTRMEYFFPHKEKSRGNAPLKEKGYCNHCSRDGNHEATCWALHPYILPKRNKKTRKTPPRETTSEEVLQGNLPPREDQLPERGQISKEDMFFIMDKRMGKILELVESGHICKLHVAIQTP
jgi:hypothetical protein